MFIVFVHHEAKPDMLAAAIKRIDGNGDEMSRVPGFLYRYRTRNKTNELKISTVTGWVDEAAYDAWLVVKAGLSEGGSSPSPYVRVVNERHFVERTHDDRG